MGQLPGGGSAAHASKVVSRRMLLKQRVQRQCLLCVMQPIRHAVIKGILRHRRVQHPSQFPLCTVQLHKNDRAYFILKPDNLLRTWACALIKWPWFNRFVLAMILLNCASLAATDPMCNNECDKTSRWSQVEVGHRACFGLTLLLLLCALCMQPDMCCMLLATPT